MIRFSKIFYWIALAGIVVLAASITNLFAQTNDTPISEETEQLEKVTEVDPAPKVEPQLKDPAPNSPGVNIDAATAAEIQRGFNELRSEYLDDRADYIDMWLAVIAIVLTFFGIAIAIAGYMGFREFLRLRNEADKQVKESQRLRNEANEQVAEIRKDKAEFDELMQNMRQKGSAEVFDVMPPEDSEEFEITLHDLQQNPELSVVDEAIMDVFRLQRDGAIDEAIEKWNSIADAVEGIDDNLAARAWFSVGYLRLQNQDPEIAIPAYDEAIRLNPSYVEAYNNRGNAKNHLGQREEAMVDYDEAIALDPHYADAYCNRGKTKCELDQYEAAIADCDTAIQLRLDFSNAYVVRGEAKTALGDVRGARMDFETALILLDSAGAQDQRDLRVSIVLGLRELNDVE